MPYQTEPSAVGIWRRPAIVADPPHDNSVWNTPYLVYISCRIYNYPRSFITAVFYIYRYSSSELAWRQLSRDKSIKRIAPPGCPINHARSGLHPRHYHARPDRMAIDEPKNQASPREVSSPQSQGGAGCGITTCINEKQCILSRSDICTMYGRPLHDVRPRTRTRNCQPTTTLSFLWRPWWGRWSHHWQCHMAYGCEQCRDRLGGAYLCAGLCTIVSLGLGAAQQDQTRGKSPPWTIPTHVPKQARISHVHQRRWVHPGRQGFRHRPLQSHWKSPARNASTSSVDRTSS